MIHLPIAALLRFVGRWPLRHLVLLLAAVLGVDLLFPERVPAERLLGLLAFAVAAAREPRASPPSRGHTR